MTIGAHEISRSLADAAAHAIDDKKGLDVAVMDVSDHLVITDVFVMATGTSRRHVRSLSETVAEKLRDDLDRRPLRKEGVDEGNWILLDYGDIVVHLFDQETRDFYDLERLWGDAPRIAFEPAAAEA